MKSKWDRVLEYEYEKLNAGCNCRQMNAAAVAEVVATVMDHVLSVNPRHPSWLRTQADLNFGKRQVSSPHVDSTVAVF